MIRLLAKWAAKKYYVLNQEFQASTADLHAGLSLRLAGEKRALIEKLNKEAEDIEANIKKVDDQLAAGYYECENGHEKGMCMCALPGVIPIVHVSGCSRDPVNGKCECGKPLTFIKRDLMTGQEKYEADREKTEAQKIAENKRATAKAEEDNAEGSEKAAKYFQDQAKNNRTIAERIKSL